MFTSSAISKIDPKGRIVVPINMRASLNLIEGSKVRLVATKGNLSVFPIYNNYKNFSTRKTIGILGGMGPEASADMYSKIIRFCQLKYKARLDEDYPPMVIYNLPAPQMINGVKDEERLLYALIEGIGKLENAGADFIVIACNTVHYFLPKLKEFSKVPILSIIEEVSKRVKKSRFKKVGLLATETTVKENLYKNELDKYGIEQMVPDDKSQEKVQKIIRDVIAGDMKRENVTLLKSIIRKFKIDGSEAVILGCTDLPIILNENNSNIVIFDSTNILSEVATDFAYGDCI